MSKKGNRQILGLTQTQFIILSVMGVLILCTFLMIGGYILHDLTWLNSSGKLPSTVASTSATSQSIQPSLQPTNASPTLPPEWTSTPTHTPQPTRTPAPTNTPLPTRTPAATNTPQPGTFNNPIKLDTSYTFPGLGTLTVLRTLWRPNQTGYAIVEVSFKCERPTGQECNTGDFMLDAIGGSGNGYERGFDTAIPRPDFGSFTNPAVYGGGAETGYAGFLITKQESSLLVRVRLFLKEGEVFFMISP